MATIKDPVCSMEIDRESVEATVEYQGKTYSFCSPICKTKFMMNPGKYTENQEHSAQDHKGHQHNH